jgi:DNA polymerase III alpha subunit (gram-positive type)
LSERIQAGDAAPSSPVRLKPRGATATVPYEWEDAGSAPGVALDTPLRDAEYVALYVETTGNAPFLVIEIGAERFAIDRPLSLFDTLVHCRAPINAYAKRRHQIDREMLQGAPEFGDARGAFLHFGRGAVLVEHSHDAFDTYLIARGLRHPLPHPVIDTSTMARFVLDLPLGQTPGLARVVELLGVNASPAHAALGDAQATAAVCRELLRRGRERFGWGTVGDVVGVLVRREVDRSAMERGGRGNRPRTRGRRTVSRAARSEPPPG